jgi:hypothetical protein
VPHEDRIAAAHEGGHVLVAHAEGWEIAEASILPNSAGGDGYALVRPRPSANYVEYAPGTYIPARFRPKRCALWPLLRVALAGAAGVHRFDPLWTNWRSAGVEADMEKAHDLLERCSIPRRRRPAILAARRTEADRILHRCGVAHDAVMKALLDAFRNDEPLSAERLNAVLRCG